MFEIPLLIVALLILAKFGSDLRRGLADIVTRLERIDSRLEIQGRDLAALAQLPLGVPAPAPAPAAPPLPALAPAPAPAPGQEVDRTAPVPAAPAVLAQSRSEQMAAPDSSAGAPPEPRVEPDVPPPEPPPIVDEPPGPPHRGNLAELEQRFGTQWVVWVGGLALALGGIFLIRYSIEQGYFGPGLRVAMGALLAFLLVGTGEWLRRIELRSGQATNAVAHIPGILTAAGTTVAYATVYGAYALYGFLSPALAFLLLGVVALATLAAALVHGPMLAGLGLVGAYVTPLLVTTAQPNYWALYVYLAVVTAAAFALARVRLWRWLAITAAVFGMAWMLPGIGDKAGAIIAAHVFFAATGFALSATFIVAGLLYGPPAEEGHIDPVSSAIPAGFLLTAFLSVIATLHAPLAIAVFLVLVVGGVVIALRSEAATGIVPVAATLAVLAMLHWAVDLRLVAITGRGWSFDYVPSLHIESVGLHLLVGAVFATTFGGGAFLAQGRSRIAAIPVMWAVAGALAPIAILIALYWRLYEFERALPLAVVALIVAALYGWAAERMAARDTEPGGATAVAIFASAGIAALALTLTFALEKGWLTVALALMTPGIALVSHRRPWPMLRWTIAVMVAIVLARILWNPRIIGADLAGTTPILNWILYAYGVPALAFWTAGHLLRRRGDDLPARMTDSAAITFTVLLFFFEIRHVVYNGDVFHPGSGLAEAALQVSLWLATAIGLERARLRTGSVVHDWGARILTTFAFAGIVFGLGIGRNPMLTAEPVGGMFFNLVLLGYGLPAALMAALARIVRSTRPRPIYVTAAVTAIVLALAYLSLEVRTLFHGPVLAFGPTSDAEQYAYSAAWLAFGVALLVAGIALASQPARLASAAVITLTAAKVFLYDLAGVEGVFRAFSFIGLGLVLIGIGWLYQRLLFPRQRITEAA
jgi:uncharacterized membrane protein